MNVESVTPEYYTGSVSGDPHSRRGADPCAGHARQRANVVNAMVPPTHVRLREQSGLSMSPGGAPPHPAVRRTMAKCRVRAPSEIQASSPESEAQD